MPCNEYVLTKTTKAGWRLYFGTDITALETSEGHVAYVGQTSPFEGDARRLSPLEAEEYADFLNECGIGGAPWSVQPAN